MRRILALGGALAAFLPTSVLGDQADSWLRNCQAGATAASVSPSAFVCFTPAAADNNDETPILNTTACTNGADIFLFDDVNGTGTVCTVAWQPEMCPTSAAVDTQAERDLACAPIPGVAAMSADDAELNIGVMRLRMAAGGAGLNPTSCRIEVRCSDGVQ